MRLQQKDPGTRLGSSLHLVSLFQRDLELVLLARQLRQLLLGQQLLIDGYPCPGPQVQVREQY